MVTIAAGVALLLLIAAAFAASHRLRRGDGSALASRPDWLMRELVRLSGALRTWLVPPPTPQGVSRTIAAMLVPLMESAGSARMSFIVRLPHAVADGVAADRAAIDRAVCEYVKALLPQTPLPRLHIESADVHRIQVITYVESSRATQALQTGAAADTLGTAQAWLDPGINGSPVPLAAGRIHSIGRLYSNTVALPNDPHVSGRHALIDARGPQLVLTDDHSVNGTKVNGSAVTRPCALEDGDEVTFGTSTFVVRYPSSCLPGGRTSSVPSARR
jgi:FHA domain